ncbi:Uncharacterized protein C4G9.04c [Grifola frondosa]|uniref:Uncharacterized protein C4G9.04c n=1 Tax=Grifola frondosa TaxID=5627 RepID=A0A1C7M1G9_GRIFR|nr:Uncharacterized protein C4G9.04c [Grifola frondosa]
MSLYPIYAQVPYAAAGYPVPPPPPVGYGYPPPVQPVYHVDPNMFRRDYMLRLADLTSNSRPAIQNLSMIAHDHSRFADVVVQCIESHIRRVPPWMKLPAFYLLDAISKNVFDPYARHFTPIVVPLFLDTYEQVDQNTRGKMEEMLLTWRAGAPNGRELFGVVTQVAIERQIWDGNATQTAAVRDLVSRIRLALAELPLDQSSSRQPGSSSGISTAQVLSELEFVLGQKERSLLTNPYDRVAQNHVTVLQQLRKLVQAGVSQNELGQILNQLRGLTTPAPAAVAPPPPAPTYQSYPISSSYQPPPSYPISYDQAKSETVDLSSMLSLQPIAVPSAPSTSSAPAANIASLYSALLKAGVVSATGTPTGAGATAKAEASSQPVDSARDAARNYRKAILSHKVKLTSSDITKRRPPIIHFLYKQAPVQCKQCAIRFSDGVKGKKDFEDHLDMHFRQNRKASQAVGRGHSRSWFVGVEDWIHDGVIDNKGKGRADGSRLVNAKAVAAAEAAKREAELRALHVVVPPGDEAKPISCPICKEPLKSEFLEDDEEWVWRNAVKKDDRVYLSCDVSCGGGCVEVEFGVRLRSDVSSRSRSRTPEKSVSRTTPPKVPSTPLNGGMRQLESPSPSKLAGLKRKAEDDNASTSKDEDNAPQPKRQATSS